MTDEAMKSKVIALFNEMNDCEEEVKEIKNTEKEMFNKFLEENEQFTKKGLRAGFKFYRQIIKDKAGALATEDEIDQVKNLITEM